MVAETLRKNKKVKVVLLLLLALCLLLAVWAVFFRSGEDLPQTEEEARLSALLSEIEGVKQAKVMIASEDGVPVRAVVVFSGEDGILVRTRLMEAAATALNLRTGDILVYPAKS